MVEIKYIARITFIGINAMLVLIGVILMIYGFAKNTNGYWAGSFWGGWLPSLAAAMIMYSLAGLWGAWRGNRQVLIMYGALAAASIICRVITWIFTGMYHVTLRWDLYFLIVPELLIVVTTYFIANVIITSVVESEIITSTSTSNKNDNNTYSKA